MSTVLELMRERLELEGIAPSWAEVARRLDLDVRTLIQYAAQAEGSELVLGELVARWNASASFHRIDMHPDGTVVTVILGVPGAQQ